jgi:hypothetical protein
MSNLGQARPATHGDLSQKFGGLLPRVDAPATAPDAETVPADDAAPAEAGAAGESQTETAPSAEKADPVKPKRASRRTATAASPTPEVLATIEEPAEPAPAPSAPESSHEGKSDQPVQVALPASLYQRLISFKSKTGLSHPNILFDAIDATAAELPDLIKARTVQLGSSTGTSLFNRPKTVVKRDATDEPKETFIVRITKQNKAILDGLVKDVAAPNRNVLLVVAYDSYLPPIE